MDDEVLSESTQAWAGARRLREPIAWTLLVLTAIGVLVTAGQLLGLTSSGVPVAGPVATPAAVGSSPSTPFPGVTFGVRAAAVGPQFVALGFVVLPVLSVILVAFAGALTYRARQVVWAAVSTEAIAFGFGVVSWLSALGTHLRPGAWYLFFAIDLAVAATALMFTAVVARSPALRPPTPAYEDFDDDDEDLGDDDEDSGGDEVDFGPR